MAKTIGYARASLAAGGILKKQTAELKAAGCDMVFTDVAADGPALSRPGFKQALAALADGDTLMVYRIDRLTRNDMEMAELRLLFETRGIRFKIADATEAEADAYVQGVLRRAREDGENVH